MSEPNGKSRRGTFYTTAEKKKALGRARVASRADVEREIIVSKRSIKHHTRRLDVLKEIARDYREREGRHGR